MNAFRISHRVLAIAAFVGWILFANTAIRVAPSALENPDRTITAAADGFVRARLDAVRDGGNWDRPLALSTGSAKAALERQAAANPGALADLAIQGEPSSRLLWADNGEAMVETRFTTNREGEASELLLLRFQDGSWLISDVWRVVPEPIAPLVPAE